MAQQNKIGNSDNSIDHIGDVNKMMTAVEWLEKLHKQGILISKSFEMAKAMEKEQIIKAHNQSWHDRMNPYKTAEQYYNENYNK